MANMTPPLNTQGRYVTKTPWELPGTNIYTCIAIRSFEDIYKLNMDVYETYYLPMGLVNGSTFNFSDEVAAKANIITLRGSDNSIVYIPDTYILSFPSTGNVLYQHVLLTASLGAIPEYLDLSAIKYEVESLVAAKLGSEVIVKEMVSPSTEQFSTEQHEILEAARVGSILSFENDYTKLKKAEAKLSLLDAKYKTAIAILKANGILPT